MEVLIGMLLLMLVTFIMRNETLNYFVLLRGNPKFSVYFASNCIAKSRCIMGVHWKLTNRYMQCRKCIFRGDLESASFDDVQIVMLFLGYP